MNTDEKNSLSYKQKIKLAELITKYFVSINKGDKDFAEYANQHLDFTVTSSNVASCRNALGIPSNRSRMIAESNDPETPIKLLEARVKVLENRMEVYIKGSRGDVK
jgi:hypothetical protein